MFYIMTSCVTMRVQRNTNTWQVNREHTSTFLFVAHCFTAWTHASLSSLLSKVMRCWVTTLTLPALSVSAAWIMAAGSNLALLCLTLGYCCIQYKNPEMQKQEGTRRTPVWCSFATTRLNAAGKVIYNMWYIKLGSWRVVALLLFSCCHCGNILSSSQAHCSTALPFFQLS